MIMITGATGALGNAVVKYLLAKSEPSKVAVLVRDPAKAEDLKQKGVDVRQGDYDDYESLVKAFSGVGKLFFVSGSDVVNRGLQHQNVVNAAKAAAVKHVIYTSFQRKNESDSSPIAIIVKAHVDTEKQLMESGLAYTLLRNNLYTDNIPMFIGDQVLQTGTVYLPAGEGKAAFATRDNMAEAAANILAGDGHQNKVYDFANNDSVSFREIAAMVSEIAGKSIEYVSPAVEDFKAGLKNAGVPEGIIAVSAGFSEAIDQNEFNLPDNTLETLLGKRPDSVQDYLKTIYA